MTRGHLVPGVIGRDDELAWLAGGLADVIADGAGTVVVGGEPGIGKTSLVGAFVERSAELEHVGIGRFRSQDVEPFAGLWSAVAGLVGHDAAATLRDAVDDMGGSSRSTVEAAAAHRYRAYAMIATALLDAVADAPALLVLDDIHWGLGPLHEFVMFLIEEMERRRRSHRLLLALVTRVLPPPHAVAHLLADLERRQRVWRLDLGALAEENILQIVTRTAGREPSGAYREVARRSAKGNPLRAKAVVGLLRQRGVDVRAPAADQRTWREMRMPLSIDDPVVSWIAGLEPAVRSSLGVAAVVATEVPLTELLRLGALAAPVELGIEIGLLQSDGSSVWFAHSLYREVLYDQLSPSERREAHLRVARHLGTTATTAEERVTVARHVLAAGDQLPLAERTAALRAGGNAALELTLWNEAAQLLEASGAADPPGVTPDDLVALGRAYYFDHDLDAAAPALRRAVGAADEAGREDLWAEALGLLLRMMLMSSTTAWRRPDDDDLMQRYLSVATDPGGRARLLEVRAEAQIAAGRVDAGERAAREAITLAEASDRPEILAFAYYALSFADATAMRMHEALDGGRKALMHARASTDWYIRDTLATRLSYPLLATGELDEADELALDCVERATATHEHSNLSLGLATRAAAALLRGDLDSVERLVQGSADAGRRASYAMTDLFAPGTAFLGHLYRGELQQAEQVIDEWPNIPRAGRRGFRVMFDALSTQPSSLQHDLRPPSGPTQVAAGYFVAALDGALMERRFTPPPDVRAVVERWHESGLEYAASYPTSLTRICAELAAASGDADEADALFALGVDRCEAQGARTELARVLAGWARHARSVDGAGSSRANQYAARARELAGRIGLDHAVLGLDAIESTVLPEHGAWRVVLVTDIVGSTAISTELGDVAYLDLVLRHHTIVRRSLEAHGGHEFSEAGDGLLAWFPTTAAALAAAREVQRGVEEAGRSEGRLAVRVALAGGVPLFHGGRPYGAVLNRASRIVAEAAPGRIVVDEPVAAQLDAGAVERSETVELRGIGPHRIGLLARTYQNCSGPSLSG
jgi:class 3 adenylate cyclase